LAAAGLLGRAGLRVTLLEATVVRVQTQNATAQAVAEFLREHPRVARVNYPGLDAPADPEVARKQMRGFGGMLSFVYDGDARQTAAVVDRLRVFSIAASLGGVESLVTQPITTTHHGMTPEERARRGIVDGLVQVSCGLEDALDLVADLDQALGDDRRVPVPNQGEAEGLPHAP
jgi:cystathionine gamma-synthase